MNIWIALAILATGLLGTLHGTTTGQTLFIGMGLIVTALSIREIKKIEQNDTNNKN